MSTAVQLQASETSVFGRMARLLDIPLASESDAVRLVVAGISTYSYKRVASKLGLSASLVAPESTIRRRLSSNARFSEAESERVVRLTRVYAEAVELFGGDESAALLWLNTPADYLPDQPAISPLHLSVMDSGARLIESHIRRTAHGIF